MASSSVVSGMLNRLHGQPESYDKKYANRPPTSSLTMEPNQQFQSIDQNIASVEHLALAHMEWSVRRIAPRAKSLSRSF